MVKRVRFCEEPKEEEIERSTLHKSTVLPEGLHEYL
jgi:hypothetical protein